MDADPRYVTGAAAAIAGLILLTAFAALGVYDTTPEQKSAETIIDQRQVSPTTTIRTVRSAGNTTSTEIHYRMDGRNYTAPFNTRLEPSLTFLRNSTPANAKITAWWDHGHSIRGYANRTVVATNPSRWAWQHTTAAGQDGRSWDRQEKGPLADRSTLQDVARILLTDNETRASRLMRSHNSRFLYLTAADIGKYGAFTMVANRSSQPTASISQVPCARARNGRCGAQEINGTDHVIYPTQDGPALAVPIASTPFGISITGPARLRTRTGTTLIPRACTESGVRTFSVNESAMTRSGCVALHPDFSYRRILYIPPAAIDSMFTRLYIMDGANVNRFGKWQDAPLADIWVEKRPDRD